MEIQISLLLLVLLASSSDGEGRMTLSPEDEWRLGYEPSSVARGSNGDCTENGIFQMLGSCRDFYQCSDWDGRSMRMYHFTCPPRMIFEDRFENCHYPTMDTTKPECDNMYNKVGYTIRDRNSVPLIQSHNSSLKSQENGTHGILEQIAKSANGTCILIYHVDKYVSRVRATIPVILPDYIDVTEFKYIVERYNSNLMVAQSNTYGWRNGQDIMTGIRRTYELANLFAPEFQKKYYVLEKRIVNLKNASADAIKRTLSLNSDIENLKVEIKEIVNFLIDGTPSNTTLIFFQKIVDRKEAAIEKKQMELNEMGKTVLKTLHELVIFMEFVRDDASQIAAKANSTKANVKIFKNNVSQDKVAFTENKKVAQQGITNLEIQKNFSLMHIQNIKVKIELAEKDRDEKLNETRNMEVQIGKELDIFHTELKEINKEHSEELLRIIDSRNSFLGVLKVFFGGADRSASDLLKNMKESTAFRFRIYHEQVSLHNSLIMRRTEEISWHNQHIQRLENKLDSEQVDMRKLSFVDYYLESVIDKVEKILPLITDALKGLAVIEETFDTIISNLETLIYQAKTTKVEAEAQNTEFIIYKDLSRMQSVWNESYANIISLGKCTRDDFYHILTQLPETNATTTTSELVTVTELNELPEPNAPTTTSELVTVTELNELPETNATTTTSELVTVTELNELPETNATTTTSELVTVTELNELPETHATTSELTATTMSNSFLTTLAP